MRRHLESESRKPGMQASRHCPDCDALLEADGQERCVICRPALSQQARLVGAARRREREQIEQAERQISNLNILIKKMYRRLK